MRPHRLCTRTPLALAALALALLGSASALSAQQPDTLPTHVLRTRDGSTFIGRLINESADSVRFLTIGGAITVARLSVSELRVIPTRAIHRGEYWTADPNDTRLFFAPTGRMLAKGEGYFSDTYLLLLNFVGGVTPRFTMGGGFSIIPSTNPQNNFVYITPKLSVLQGEKLNIAVGLAAAFAGFEDIDDDMRSLGVVYGVGTYGSPDASFTFGTGLGYTGKGMADRPVFMLGGSVRSGRRSSLISENYLFPSADNNGIITYGVRFFGEKLSVDLAFGQWLSSDSEFIFPGIPYISMALKF